MKKYFSVIAGAGVLGCVFIVAGCAAPITTTTTTKPARFQEAAQLREVVVVPFSGPGGDAFTTVFKSMLISSQDVAGQAHIQVKDYPQSSGYSGQTDLRSIGRSAGVQGVYAGEVTYYGVQRQPYSVERTKCTSSSEGKKKGFLGLKHKECTSTSKHTVSCERRIANVAVVPRLVSVATGKTVYSKARSGTAESSHCQDETDTTSDGELLGIALKNVLAQIQADVTVHTEEIKVSWKDSTDGLSDAQAERFKGALAFAKQGDSDEACRRFRDLRSENVDTQSLKFNLAICDEVADKLTEAKQQLVAINRSLSSPDNQVIEAINRIDKKIAEQEPLKTQTQSSSQSKVSKPSAKRRPRNA